MPIHWEVHHATRTVVVTAEGTLGLGDLEDYLDGMESAATLSYRKLFDMTRCSSALSNEDLNRLRPRIEEETRLGPRGPAAIVAVSEENHRQAQLLISVTADVPHRPVRIFREFQAAADWLSTEPVLAAPFRESQSDLNHR
jgi:hypothetical protein